MATIKICDRCGAAINPVYSVSRVVLERSENVVVPSHGTKELCVSCAFALREWLQNKPFPMEGEK